MIESIIIHIQGLSRFKQWINQTLCVGYFTVFIWGKFGILTVN